MYKSREKHILNIDTLIDNIIEIKSLVSNNKTETYNEKWCITDNALLVT